MPSLSDVSAFITAHGPWAAVAVLLLLAIGFVVRQNLKLYERIDTLQEKRVEEARQSIEAMGGFRTTLESNTRVMEALLNHRSNGQ